MTSKQVLLTLIALVLGTSLLGGCTPRPTAPSLTSPYPSRQVWAIAPILNESGSTQANGLVIADHLARQLENASQIDVLPVNRVLAVMQSQRMTALRTPGDVQRLMQLLGADYLVAGTITAWDPYDPPKLGLAIELFASEQVEKRRQLNLRRLSSASTDENTQPPPPANAGMPVSLTSGYFDAASPQVRAQLKLYGERRSQDELDGSPWRLYRINMNLYCEFVSYVMSWRLLEAEKYRFSPQSVGTDGASPATQPASP